MRVLVDSDGVLFDFVSTLCVLLGRIPSDLMLRWPRGVYALEEVIGVSMDEMWKVVDDYGAVKFWTDLEPYYGALPFFAQLLANFGDDNVFISTSPVLRSGCAEGKTRCFHKHFGAGFRHYMIGQSKYLMAREDALLIDDCDSNIDSFIAEGGGKGLLFPRPWNSRHSEAWSTDLYNGVLEEAKAISRLSGILSR